MAPPEPQNALLAADWLGFARRAAAAASAALERYPETGDRAETVGRGEGGDETLVIDAAVEDAIFGELERLGEPVRAISEERGEVEIAGGGPVHVVIDPVDGSRNAKRDFPAYCVSIAVADGPTMADVAFAFVHDFARGEEWSARRGEGAWRGADELALDSGHPLDVLALESTHPYHVARNAEAIREAGPSRLRALGSIALALCWIAGARVDAMASLAHCRSVDAAAGQLIVREAGGAARFPDAGDGELAAPLELGMRSRVQAANGPEALARLDVLPAPG